MSGVGAARKALKTIGKTTATVDLMVNGRAVATAQVRDFSKQAISAEKAVQKELRETARAMNVSAAMQSAQARSIAAADRLVAAEHKVRANEAKRVADAERASSRSPQARAARGALATQYRNDGTMASILGGPRNINVTTDAIRKAKAEVGQLDERMGRLDKTGRTVGGTFEMVRNTIFRFAVGYTVIAGIQRGMEELTAATIGYNNTLQTAQIGLTNLLGGNAEGARGLIKDLEAFAIKTPFNFQDLVPYTNQLKAVGFALRDIMPTIEAVGEAAAGTGLGADGMGRIIYALGQIRSAGKLAGTEVRQLTEANIPVLKYLSQAYGVTTAQIQKMISDGLVPAEKAIEAIRKGIMQKPSEGGFFGSLEAKSKAFLGSLSNIKDALQKTFGEATTPAFNRLSDFTYRMAQFASSDEFAVWASNAVGALMKGADAAEYLWGAITRPAPAVKAAVLSVAFAYGVLKVQAAQAAIAQGISMATVSKSAVQVALAEGKISSLAASTAILSGRFAALRAALMGLSVAGAFAGFVAALPAILAVSAAVGVGYKLWGYYAAHLERVVDAQVKARKSANEMHKAMSEAIDYAAPDPAVVQTLTSLRQQLRDAGSDTGKVQAAIERMMAVRRQIVLSTKLGNSTKELLMRDLGMTEDFKIKQVASLKVEMDEKSKGWWAGFIADVRSLVLPGSSSGGYVPVPGFNAAPAPAKAASPREALARLREQQKFQVADGLFTGRPSGNAWQDIMARVNHAVVKGMADKEQGRGGKLAGSLDPSKDILSPSGKSKKRTPEEIAAEKARRAALKLEKDQLQDLIDVNNKWAKSTEDAAKRAIDAFSRVGDELRNLLGGFQDSLFRQGLDLGPLNKQIAAIEKLVNLRGNVHGVAAAAMGKLRGFDETRGVAQSRLDVISGGDGSGAGYGPVTDKGMAVAEAAMERHLRGSAEQYRRYCQRLLRHTVQDVTPEYNKFFAGTARKTMENFQRAGIGHRYTPGESLSPGSMLYTGRMGGKSGHAMLVGPDGRIIDNVGRGLSTANRRKIDWVVPQGGRAVAGGVPAGAARRASGDPVSFAEDLLRLNPSLSKIAGLPKAWGSQVKDAAGNTARFAAQMLLVDKTFQNIIRSRLGDKVFAQIAAALRKVSNEVDTALNVNEARLAAFAASRDLDKKARLRGKENDPLAELNEYYANDPVGKKTPKREQAVIRAKTLKDVIDDAALATRRFVGAQRDQVKALDAGESLLRTAQADTYGYQRAVDLTSKRIEIWNGLEKERNANAKQANEMFREQYAAFVALYDRQKATARQQEEQGAQQSLRERLWLLVEEGKALANVALNQSGVNELIERQRMVLEQTNSLFALGHTRQRATELATQRAQMEAQIKLQERRNELDREWRDIQLDSRLRSQTSAGRVGIFGSTVSGSREQERLLAQVDAFAEIQKQQAEGRFDTLPPVFGRPGANRTDWSAIWKRAGAVLGGINDAEAVDMAGNSSQANLQSRNAVYAAENTLTQRQLELRGQLTDVRRQEMDFALDELMRQGTKNEVTAQEVLDRQKILDLVRQTAALDVDFARRDAMRELSILRQPPGYLRDRMARGYELADRGMTPEQIAQIQGYDEMVRKATESTRIMDGLWDSAHDTISSTIGAIQRDGVAGFKGLFDGILDGLNRFAQEFLTNMIWNQILAKVSGVKNTLGGGSLSGIGGIIAGGIGAIGGGHGGDILDAIGGQVAGLVNSSYDNGSVGRALVAPRSMAVATAEGSNGVSPVTIGTAIFPNVRRESDIPSAAAQVAQQRNPRSATARQLAQNTREGERKM